MRGVRREEEKRREEREQENSEEENMAKRKQRSEEIFLITNPHENDGDVLYRELSQIGQTVRINTIDEVDLDIVSFIRAIVFDMTRLVKDADISWIRRRFNKSFVVIHDPTAVTNPEQRLRWFDAGANMVSHDIESLVSTLQDIVLPSGNKKGIYTCPYCNFHTLTEDELREHMPLYHINWPNAKGRVECPICYEMINKPIQVHLHEDHGPIARSHREFGSPPQPIRGRLQSSCLVVCFNTTNGCYLLTQSFGNEGYWLPGGFLEPGESFVTAAERVCQLQCGISVTVRGILGMAHVPNSLEDNHVSFTMIMYAEPNNCEEIPKSIPDYYSVGSCWGGIEQITTGLKLKGTEATKWIRYHAEDGTIFPITVIFEKISS